MAAKISLLVAHDDKLGIGKNNKLLFLISEDLKRFKRITMGHPIIMGRKTFASIGRVLPGRTNIIVTRNPDFQVDGAEIVYSLEKAIHLGRSLDQNEIFIIGGCEIFKQALEQDLVDKLYVTKVARDFGAEIFFPPYPEFTNQVFSQLGIEGDYHFEFLELTK